MPGDHQELRRDSDHLGLSYFAIKFEDFLKKAAVIEQEIWNEKSYGDLRAEGYTPYIEKSHTFGAFDSERNCVGMNRMFKFGEQEHLPFLKLTFFDETKRVEYQSLSRSGLIEELGTVAVTPPFRGKGVNLRLWRLAYRDARSRGILMWAIIMEPERVDKMNKYRGFRFDQIGPAVAYQGGVCAPFLMDLQQVDRDMKKTHPIKYFWFVLKRLNP